jgi:hypothetical protein
MYFRELIIKFSKLRRVDFKTIWFEGGLGSQILSQLRLLDLQNQGKKFYVDLRYFKKLTNQSIPGLSNWNWELNDFGISLDSLNTFTRRKIHERFHALFWRRPSNNELIIHNLESSYLKISDEVRERFPIDTNKLEQIRRKLGILNEEYYLVHLRLGDYLNVSSRVISIIEIERALMLVEGRIKDNLFFVSDSPPSPELQSLIREMQEKNKFRVEYLSGNFLSPVELHCFMRSANGLVASNSTFSFTAGLLSSEMNFFLYPNSFYSASKNSSTLLFTREADWCLINPAL